MTIPVVLFTYARPNHLLRTLASLRENEVPLIYAFSDGPRTEDKRGAVQEVRAILHAIDWAEVHIVERATNYGLGTSILAGVGEVFEKHESLLVFEDDLICVPGTYAYLCAALERYQETPEVMSVTGWTHPRVTPPDVGEQPYFDGRSECLVWGTWRSVWPGMQDSALTLMNLAASRGIDPRRYGDDLPAMALVELQRNIWAVRFLYLHIANRGLCLRPPWSMVEHIGFDAEATNSSDATEWANPALRPCPAVPSEWPAPSEHPACPALWRSANNYNLPYRMKLRLRHDWRRMRLRLQWRDKQT